MMRRKNLVCLLAVAILLPFSLLAEHTRYWRQTDFSEFQKGTAKGVAVRSDGKLRPALKFDSFADLNLAYVWALRMNSHGQLYAAGGSDAKVLRFDDAGKPTTVSVSYTHLDVYKRQCWDDSAPKPHALPVEIFPTSARPSECSREGT